MAEIEKKPVKIVETILRDAHQSLIATRMTTDQMMPIVDKMDKVGYHAVECWGGATFDASLRFLKEDPWERLRKFRDGFKNTKLQMLFRGQNILGYRPYADDVVEYFVQKSVANGIDIIRIFDCLNDMRNLQTAVTAANKEKAQAQVAMSYTLGDAYTLEYWVDLAKRIEDATGIETRATILGHMQRGGSPTCKDRVYASTMGAMAVDLLCQGKTNRVVGYQHGEFVDFDIEEALAMKKTISAYQYDVAKSLAI